MKIKKNRQWLKKFYLKKPVPFRKAYSQQGEDLVLDCLFQWNRTGFYVDIGAHHPLRYSNTQLFYAKGWRGINIDPNPGAMLEFARLRPGGINLELGIADKSERLVYYVFSDAAINTFDEASARIAVEEGRSQLIKSVSIPTRTLSDVLDEHLPPGKLIDFLSVDAEGFDEKILRSNNWSKYRPKAIMAEDLDAFTFEQVVDSKLSGYLKGIGYIPISKLVHSVVYCEVSRIRGGRDALIA